MAASDDEGVEGVGDDAPLQVIGEIVEIVEPVLLALVTRQDFGGIRWENVNATAALLGWWAERPRK